MSIRDQMKALLDEGKKPDVDGILLDIAKKHLRVDNFKDVGHDEEDFVEVARSSIGQALRAAYEMGKLTGQQQAITPKK
jgi:hypothetical protein